MVQTTAGFRVVPIPGVIDMGDIEEVTRQKLNRTMAVGLLQRGMTAIRDRDLVDALVAVFRNADVDVP